MYTHTTHIHPKKRTSSAAPGVQLRALLAWRFRSSITLGHAFSLARVTRGSPSLVMGRAPFSSSSASSMVDTVSLSMQRLVSIKYS